ncbi:MAG: BACON domain-containing protein, partial [Bacteroidota bacterium]
MKIRFFCIFLVAICLIAGCQKEEVTPKGSLIVSTYNSFGQVLPDTRITIKSSSYEQPVKSNGTSLFLNIPSETYTVSISHKKFISQSEEIFVKPNDTTEIGIRLNPGETCLSLTDSIFQVNADSHKLSVSVESNSKWVVASNSSWIIPSLKSGDGDQELEIQINQNESLDLREGIIEVSSGDLERQIKITQGSILVYDSYSFKPGNLEGDAVDSVYLRFNNPVEVTYIVQKFNNCNHRIKHNYLNEGKTVRFSFDCAKLGGIYPIEFKVNDSFGNTILARDTIEFFDQRIVIGGRILDYQIDDNTNTFWVSTTHTNKITAYDIDDLSVKFQMDLPYAPTAFCLNPYNKYLYIAPSSDPMVYVYEMFSNTLVKKIPNSAEPGDHPEYPKIYPYDIEFTSSGLGVVLTKDYRGFSTRWKIIDSSKGDTVYVVNQSSTLPIKFEKIYSNFNNSKILFLETSGSAKLTVLDGNSGELSRFFPSSSTRGTFITPNRKNGSFYMGQLYNQFVTDLENNKTSETLFDNREFGSADF